jgi:acyl carrier protein
MVWQRFLGLVSKGASMIDQIRVLLTESLGLGNRGRTLTADSPLLGEIPELDSMAVVAVITAIEDRYDIEFDDDELTAESFATLGTLTVMVERKVDAV